MNAKLLDLPAGWEAADPGALLAAVSNEMHSPAEPTRLAALPLAQYPACALPQDGAATHTLDLASSISLCLEGGSAQLSTEHWPCTSAMASAHLLVCLRA